ncbi:MAG: IS30 family transposase [Bacteroidales bacterium]
MKHLTREQRYTISVMLKQNYKQIEIARAIGKSKSVISREIKRNSNERGFYSFTTAQMYVDVRKERYCRPRKFTKEVKARVEEYLQQRWSPDQIVGYCKLHKQEMVSCEMIYKYIREDKRQGGVLYTYCRHNLKHRKRAVGGCSTRIKDRVSIEERPKAADGTRFGDWEMDLIIGKANKDAMLTLVERKTGFTIIENLPNGKDSKALSKTVCRVLFPYRAFVKTITTDNGSEFADHKTISKRLNTQIFFAHPYSSWEKGLIEYTNKLYRQYIPKKTCFGIPLI